MTGFEVPASGLLHLRMSRAISSEYQARRTTVWEKKFKQARVGAIDPGAWDLLSSSSIFVRATLVVGLVLASSSEAAGLPKCRAWLLGWTRRRLLAQLESREEPLEWTYNTILAPYTG